jgi:hypothetical protein
MLYLTYIILILMLQTSTLTVTTITTLENFTAVPSDKYYALLPRMDSETRLQPGGTTQWTDGVGTDKSVAMTAISWRNSLILLTIP